MYSLKSEIRNQNSNRGQSKKLVPFPNVAEVPSSIVQVIAETLRSMSRSPEREFRRTWKQRLPRGKLRDDINSCCLAAVRGHLRVAKTYCDLSRNPIFERRQRSLGAARKAVLLAEKYMTQLQMADEEFDQITATVELLKFDLDRFDKEARTSLD
jgi:hypothetical protein